MGNQTFNVNVPAYTNEAQCSKETNVTTQCSLLLASVFTQLLCEYDNKSCVRVSSTVQNVRLYIDIQYQVYCHCVV